MTIYKITDKFLYFYESFWTRMDFLSFLPFNFEWNVINNSRKFHCQFQNFL